VTSVFKIRNFFRNIRKFQNS